MFRGMLYCSGGDEVIHQEDKSLHSHCAEQLKWALSIYILNFDNGFWKEMDTLLTRAARKVRAM